MNGILLGVLATITVIAVLSGVRLALHRRRFLRRRGRGFMARRVLRRLEATPEQERLFLSELEALGQALRDARHGFLASREDLARLLEADVIDPAALGELGTRESARLEAVRERLTAAIARFHASLDGRQRRLLAEMLRSRPAHASC